MSQTDSYRRICRAVDNFESEDGGVFLRALESDDDYVRWYGIQGCGLKKLRESVPKLVQILGQPCRRLDNTDPRRIAAWALGEIGFQDMEALLEEGVRSENPLLREGLADALGITHDKRAIPYLERLVADGERQVALWAALSLSKIGEAAIESIEKCLQESEEDWRAAYLLDALQKIGTLRSQERLAEHLGKAELAGLREVLERIQAERTSSH